MSEFSLLSEPIRRYINDKRWEALRPIQSAAIKRIMGTEDHYILVSRTASGKTEAAFLPILSKVNFKDEGVQVLYISPLIALINDQFARVEDLCRYMDVTVTRWHGEANITAKKRLLKQPEGILLITPESIESLFCNRPENARALFSKLKFIVIDEIHTFLGSDRGMHLRSLLSRIGELATGPKPRIVGLSATVGDYEEAKRFTGDPANTKVLIDPTAKGIKAYFKFSKGNEVAYQPDFIAELYRHVHDRKVLIFPNTRGNAEELAVKLKKMAERKKGHPYYFSHHSAVDKDLREYVEEFVKNNKRHNFCIACTSTLELGIDIGTVETVIQVDATHSIASLIQRVGRSGRKEGEESKLLLYATENWSMLQSFACWELFKEQFVEPVYGQIKPYDLLFHQTLSILKETNGLPRQLLVQKLHNNAVFTAFTGAELDFLLDDMIKRDFIEDLRRELIVGVEGEKLTSSRDFYSMFASPVMLKVIHAGNTIGELEVDPAIVIGDNVLLAARIWKITDIDFNTKKVYVTPANDGKKPKFSSGTGDVHPRIRNKMLEILATEFTSDEADSSAIESINEVRSMFREFRLNGQSAVRPVIVKSDTIDIYTFTGTKINRTLHFLIQTLGNKVIMDDKTSRISIEGKAINLQELVNNIRYQLPAIREHVRATMETSNPPFPVNKWGVWLPIDLQVEYVLNNVFDVPGTAAFLEELQLVTPIHEDTFVKE
ncbi:DEAD/DEAH box helicase [Chitinophaga rhizophila]|uniref:DEAD/DEAH box helicase n=1 Tax=Chitinophaga rhizophila TaxID=2866212 RepID=A0ABS7GH67_9BACT|nr:DEAD/DEAH box helicase [Chitinophaga rhizophila]MBW8687034.1 DEAD/DEAH box helicase [Chitinophaga rhizophila]